MSRARTSAAREGDIRRAIEAAKKSGLNVGRVDVQPDGTISIFAGELAHGQPQSRLDRIFDR